MLLKLSPWFKYLPFTTVYYSILQYSTVYCTVNEYVLKFDVGTEHYYYYLEK